SDGLSDMVSGDALEQILVRHRQDPVEATKALIGAANRGGGVDNITAIVFEIVDGAPEAGPDPAEPDERTREQQPVLDEEDTLHPEDGVLPPPRTSAGDTMVVTASEIQAAAAAGPTADEAGVASAPSAGTAQRLLALAVIAALVVVIVVLVWWGLAR
ncbi:MAG: hypothetical protein ACRDLK_11150, partial [Gaiellaceae bacterium]